MIIAQKRRRMMSWSLDSFVLLLRPYPKSTDAEHVFTICMRNELSIISFSVLKLVCAECAAL